MVVETELKLRIAPGQLARLKRSALLKALQVARPATRRLHNIYFDTPKLELHQANMALRLRHIGRQWLQTLKGGGSVQAGLHQRNEWEVPVAGEALDLDALEAVGGMHLAQAVRKRLRPVFVTDFSRTTRMLDFEGAQIELSMDSGEIRAGRSARTISELELELKSGESLQLFRMALALLDVVPLEVEHTSKAEYGYRLFARSKPAVTQAAMPDLAECPDAHSALQAMIWSCLSHLQANVAGAVHGSGDEYLHQAYIALGRLRVVLDMAGTFRADDELAALHDDVAALCAELERLRVLDVFVAQLQEPMPEDKGSRALLKAGEKLRGQQFARVRDVLQSQEFQRLLLRFGAWMHGRYWREPSAGAASSLPRFAARFAARFADRILQQSSAQVIEPDRNISAADASRLHTLFNSCMKLRYSAELFASLYAGSKAARYLSALAPLQETLGRLNDIAQSHALLAEMEGKGRHDMIMRMRGQIEQDYAGKMGEAHKVWKKFEQQQVFWDQG